jgi:UDP-N-acetylmuramoyl-L-alanyl-D-glutamate--2,6-diaminopimelate ligase
MRLSELLAALPAYLAPAERRGDADPVIAGLAYDSRRVTPGDLFVALRGAEADGHHYLGDAVRLGASAVLVEGWSGDAELADAVGVRVPDTRAALAPLARAFYGDPGSELRMVGVTGTNGKTSTTYLVESILAAAGRRVGLIGTVEIRYGDMRQRTLNTTPESLDLQRTLRAMRNARIEDVVMEVSSHGVAMGRIEGCRFDVGAFTNLTQDHLDFHETMEAYRDAKTAFFRDALRDEAVAVVNEDDPAATAFRQAAEDAGARLLRVTRDAAADAEVVLLDAALSLDATRARLRTPVGELGVELPLIGDFNLENLLVAVGTAVALEIEPEAITEGVRRCPQVPGRVERVGADLAGTPVVFVDYAHTPDAVDKLLQAVRPLARGRLVTVFGCGGDRDRGKRPLMADAAARSSHRVIATSDNPRTEDPLAILEDVEAGLKTLRRVDTHQFGRDDGTYTIVPDRREAIGLAVASASPDDIVVIAGKGHEDYQILGRDRLPFDDRTEARTALQRRVG